MSEPRIQGVPDLGPGLRLHLNENTGGCSPAVVDAVRAFDARGLATYPDYRAAVIETAAFLGVDPEWLVLTNGLDEGVLLDRDRVSRRRTQRPGRGGAQSDRGGRGHHGDAGVRDLHHQRQSRGRAHRFGSAGAGLRVSGGRHAGSDHGATHG